MTSDKLFLNGQHASENRDCILADLNLISKYLLSQSIERQRETKKERLREREKGHKALCHARML